MQENHHINKFMIELAEHAAFTGWNDITLYGEDWLSESKINCSI